MNNEARVTWMQEQLETHLQPTTLIIHDDSHKHIGHEGAKDGAGHFTVEIGSAAFDKKTLIECHRLVYQVLESAIPKDIHALKIKIKKS